MPFRGDWDAPGLAKGGFEFLGQNRVLLRFTLGVSVETITTLQVRKRGALKQPLRGPEAQVRWDLLILASPGASQSPPKGNQLCSASFFFFFFLGWFPWLCHRELESLIQLVGDVVTKVVG